MSESLRDRVARVLCAHTLGLFGPVCGCGADLDVRLHGGSRQAHAAHVADALIAAGLVAECGEPPSTAFEVMATRHGLPLMLRHGAHDNQLRVRSWTHDGDRFLVEYVEVTS